MWYYFLIIIFSIAACYKIGEWRQWNKYYATILFFITGDLIYNVLFQNHLLWRYECEKLNHTMINMIIAFTVYPSTVLIFIPHYPNVLSKQLVYLFKWIAIYFSFEFISLKLGFFTYNNGWNTLWTILFNIVLFPLLYLHYKKPLWAWFIAILELILVLIIFKIHVLGIT